MSPQTPEDQEPAELTRMHASIGRFIVNFSGLVSTMEGGIKHIARYAGGGEGGQSPWDFALADLAADRIRLIFFAMAATSCNLTENEERIRRRLAKQVQDFLPNRNDVAHGEWYDTTQTGVENPDGTVTQVISHETALVLRSTLTGSGVEDRNVSYTVQDLNDLADQAQELAQLVWQFAEGCTAEFDPGIPRVSDRLKLEDGQVVRQDLTGWLPTPESARSDHANRSS